MVRYLKPDGTTFVLLNHTHEEWADIVYASFVKLGCSETYASRVAQTYRDSTPT